MIVVFAGVGVVVIVNVVVIVVLVVLVLVLLVSVADVVFFCCLRCFSFFVVVRDTIVVLPRVVMLFQWKLSMFFLTCCCC